MPIYRLTVLIPSEVFIKVDSLKDAETFIGWLSEQYDKVCYPISSTSDTRAGVAAVKCLSIEQAKPGDNIHKHNATDAVVGMHQPVDSPESDGEPPQGPNIA
jgi:hypothetical protein